MPHPSTIRFGLSHSRTSGPLLSVVACLLALNSTVRAQSVLTPKPTLEWNGRLTTEFNFDMTEGSVHRLGFGVNRAFLGVKANLDPTWSLTMLLDAQQGELVTGLSKANMWVYLRNAYFEAKDVFGTNTAFRAGLQPTPYIASVDGVLKTRFITQSLVDATKVQVSQGGGLSVKGDVGTRLKYQLLLHNGSEGFTKAANTDNALAVAALVSFAPVAGSDSPWFKNLTVHLGTDIQAQARTAPSTTVTEAQQLYQIALTQDSPGGTAGLEYLSFNRGSLKAAGYGFTANIAIFGDATFFVRYLGGDADFQNVFLAAKSSVMFGPSYSIGAVKVALVWEQKAAIADGAIPTQTILSKWTAAF